MFYDLNIPWTSASDSELSRTLAFLAELGYDVVALNHIIPADKLPKEPVSPAVTSLASMYLTVHSQTCAIPSPLPFPVPPSLTILRRLTVCLTKQINNSSLRAHSQEYDLLALRPLDEKTLQQACTTLDCDIVSLDLSQRLGFHPRFAVLAEAHRRGAALEISYAASLVGDANARRNTIANCVSLVRASRSRGLVVSSGAAKAGACRAPWDVVNLFAVWGMKQEVAFEAVSKDARSVVVRSGLKRSSWRGVVDIIHGGEGAEVRADDKEVAKDTIKTNGVKRKAEATESSDPGSDAKTPLSKREIKRRAKRARDEATTGSPGHITAP